MRELRYSINTTLDGCCSHEVGLPPDEESMRFWTSRITESDALIYGRVTYEMMESVWRRPSAGGWPGWMREWEILFAEAIDAKRKYVVSTTLTSVDWNAELVRGDLAEEVRRLKDQPGGRLALGGVRVPSVLGELGLIDEYEFVVHPFVAGRGPTLLAGLSVPVRLELVERQEFASGIVVLRYRPVPGES